MVNLSPTQERHIEATALANAAYWEAKRNAKKWAEEQAEERVKAYSDRRDLEVRLAFEAKVPKNQIGLRGLGSSAPQTLAACLKRTEGLAAVKKAADPLAQRYSLDAATGVLTVHLTGDDLTQAWYAQDWDGDGPDSAQFTVREREDGSAFLDPITEGFVADKGLVHPIVAWFNGPAQEREALEFYRAAAGR